MKDIKEIVKKFALTLIVLFSFQVALAGAAFASHGGDSGGNASGGDGGGNGGGDNYDFNQNYDIGRIIFFSKLHCDICPLSGEELNPQAAGEWLSLLKSNSELGKQLTYRERYAVRYFLRKRFNL